MSSPAVLCHYHFIRKILKSLPELAFIQGDFQFPLRGVAFLAAGLQLALHRTEEVIHPILAGLTGALSSARGHPVQQLQGATVVISDLTDKKAKSYLESASCYSRVST